VRIVDPAALVQVKPDSGQTTPPTFAPTSRQPASSSLMANERPLSKRFRWAGAFRLVGDTGFEPVTSSV
jgi:hypothetical protein